MSTENQAPVAVKKPVKAKEKQKAVAFVNWETLQQTDDGRPVLRSHKGFALFDNEHLTREERALIDLAKKNDGVAEINVKMKIVIAQERGDIDTSDIQLAS